MTFPNHFTLITGLYPDHHGIVDNHFEDHRLGRTWDLGDRKGMTDPVWWKGGVAIWATAMAQGVTPAVEFWPSWGAGPSGRMPALFDTFDPNTSMDAEVAKMLSWLDLPPGRRPRLVLGYFFPVDEAGNNLSLVFKEVPLADGSGTVPVQFQYSNAVHGPEGPIAQPHPLQSAARKTT